MAKIKAYPILPHAANVLLIPLNKTTCQYLLKDLQQKLSGILSRKQN